MKPSLLLSWPQVLSEIWASIFVSGQTSNLRRAHKQFITRLKRAAEDKKGKWGKRHFHLSGEFLMVTRLLLLMWKMMRMFCLLTACRRMTTYKSALKWCSKSSWSSTVRGKIAQDQQTVHKIAKGRCFLFRYTTVIHQHRQRNLSSYWTKTFQQQHEIYV